MTCRMARNHHQRARKAAEYPISHAPVYRSAKREEMDIKFGWPRSFYRWAVFYGKKVLIWFSNLGLRFI